MNDSTVELSPIEEEETFTVEVSDEAPEAATLRCTDLPSLLY